jgi:hypothetical protein
MAKKSSVNPTSYENDPTVPIADDRKKKQMEKELKRKIKNPKQYIK